MRDDMKHSEWFRGLVQDVFDYVEKDRPLKFDNIDDKIAKRLYEKLVEMEKNEES